MNVNEVIANRANQLLQQRGSEQRVHPNDDVNLSQSSNDTFPTAMHIAAFTAVTERLLPALSKLKATFRLKAEAFSGHRQNWPHPSAGCDAAYARTGDQRMAPHVGKSGCDDPAKCGDIKRASARRDRGRHRFERPSSLCGDGRRSYQRDHRQFFITARNKFHALTSYDEIVHVHGAIKALAADLMKIANDVRWLASGPRSGIGEITIPANEPGSSIMPGKVNPTQSEALTMVVCQVFGNDATIGFAASQGNFQLNVFKPVIIYNFLQSITLLADAIISFDEKCAIGIEPNLDTIERHVNRSLMLVTALAPRIGYEQAAAIAKKAHDEGMTLKEAAMESGLLTEREFDDIVKPERMTDPNE